MNQYHELNNQLFEREGKIKTISDENKILQQNQKVQIMMIDAQVAVGCAILVDNATQFDNELINITAVAT